MFDITTQAVEETAIIHIKSAQGELLYADPETRQLPVQIEIYGPGSAAFGVNEARQSARETKRFNDNEMKLTSPAYEERVRETAADLAAVTKRFINFAYPPAGDATGADLYAAVYADTKLGFIVRQIQQKLKDWSAFRPGSAAS